MAGRVGSRRWKRLDLAVCVLLSILSVTGSAQQRPDSTKQGAADQGHRDRCPDRPSLAWRLGSIERSRSRVAITTRTSDDQGRFEISPLPEGRYDVWAQLPGYLEGGYLQRSALAPWGPVEVPDRGTVTVGIRLWKLGVITGQVLDDAAQPAVHVTVLTLEEDWSSEVVHLIQSKRSRAVVTDDQGMYRLLDVAPGTYVIGIAGAGTFHDGGNETGLDVDYPTAYAPGVLRADQARADYDRTGRSSERARTSDAACESSGPDRERSVVDRPIDRAWTVELLPSTPGSVLSDLDVRRYSSTDGRFQFNAVAPGNYIVRAILFTEFSNIRSLGRITMFMPPPPDPNRSIETKPIFWAEATVAVGYTAPDEIVLRAQVAHQIRGRIGVQRQPTTQ